MKKSLIVLSLVLLTNCVQNKSSEQLLGERVDSFATAFFNYQFKAAARYVDKASEKWLQYAATNVTQEDVDLLRAQKEGAAVNIDDILFTDPQETTAEIHITARHFLWHDSIGKPGSVINEGKFKFKAYLEEGHWDIRMEGLPQNEK